MTKPAAKNRMFPALLKYWRHSRGLSQLDLSLTANVSARHLSFLETGRASPSREMVLILGSSLQVPMREQNVMLQAAGHEAEFAEAEFTETLATPIGAVLQKMLDKHEPYPMVVLDWGYNALMLNQGATRLLTSYIANPAALRPPINLIEMVFNPELSRSFISNWDHVARAILCRLHREALMKPHEERLPQLIERAFSFPDVPHDWRLPDLTEASDPVLSVDIKRDQTELRFVTSMTTLSAPQNITLEEIYIESYFPLDEQTEAACHNIMVQA